MKRTKHILLTLAALLCSITASAHSFEVDGIYYNITSSTDLTVSVTYRGSSSSAYSNEYSGAVTIPSTVTYNGNTYSVTSIGESAFYYCSSLTAITIPEGVTSIGDWAFGYCSSLTSITLPEGVTSIGDQAFYYCLSLTTITLPEGVTSIGSSAFQWCSSLTTINIPKSVTSIGVLAFSICDNLTVITVADGNTVYDSRGGCNAIIETNSNTLIAGCSTTVIPASITSIGHRAFAFCDLTSITIPEGVTTIGSWAFSYCRSLTSITIPEGVTTIENWAFGSCESLTSITIPESVSTIGDAAFYGCSRLCKVINLSNLSLSKGSDSDGYVAYYAKVVYQGDESAIVGDFQFYTSDGIHSLVNYIGKDTEIVLPDSYNGGNYYIGDYAFYGCSLTSTTIPESVTSIENYAFDNCTALKKVIIEDGSSTLSLGYNGSSQGLFYDCPLEEVYLGRDLSYSSGSSYGYSPFYNKDALTHVTIGDEVTAISQYAFYDCDNIHSLTIPSGVLSIGSSAFSTPEKVIWLTNTPPTGYANAQGSINYVANDQYSSLSNVHIYPYLSSMFEVDGVKYVPVSPSERTCHAIDCAYNSTAEIINVGETTSFKGVAMKVTEVMPYTFYGNNHIKEVAISHLGNIGNYAFYNCDSIKIVNVSNQGNIGSQAFCDCDGIESVIVSNQGGVGNQAFYNCDGIKDVNISNLGNIGNQAFYNCDAIESVTISSQGDIGEQAFYDCNGIKTIDVHNRGIVGDQAFYGCNGMETAIVANLAPISSSNNDAPLTFADWTSTNKADSSTSSNTYTFTAKDGAVLSFDWWVSSESSYDKLIVTLDGSTILEKSGSLNGTYSNAVSQGEHTLIVKYTKDSSQSSGSDQANVSNIVVSKGGNAQTIAGIGSEAFSGCSSLKTVTLGDSIGSLGNKAFYQCTSLQEIVIPDSVKAVGEYCFSGCSAMESAVIGNSVTTINNYAFQNCSSLPDITILQSTTTIGNYVFSGCTQLADVIIEDRTAALNLGSNGSSPLFADCPLDSVYVGGKITYNTSSNYGYSPFYRNTLLRSVVITDREEQIYDNEFYGCTNLQNVTIGNGVKSIGNYAFSGCSSLAGFSFGSSMETIGEEAFSDCTNLTSITSHAAVPPTCGVQALDDISKWNCVLGVPLGNADAYYAADQWKEFFFINDVVEVDHYVLTYVVDGEVYHTEVLKHKDEVTMLAEPTKQGYEFSGWDKTLTTMPAEDVVISGTFTRLPVTEITITINKYGSSTYCSEYALDFSEVPGLKAYAATGYNSGSGVVTLTRVMTTQPGTGLFLKGEPGTYEVPVIESSLDHTINMLQGTLTKTSLNSRSDDGMYANYKYTKKENEAEPMFYEFADGSSLGAGKAYLQIPVVWLPSDEARSISLRFEEGEGATDIEQLTIDNSQLTIIYDLYGRKVDNPTKGGIYVVNGKKVVIK